MYRSRVVRVLAAAVAGCLVASGAAVPARAASTFVARYTFDRTGAAGLVDISGHGHTLRGVGYRHGNTRTVAHGTGRALAFPAVCAGRSCPRVVLSTPHAAALNPGTRPIAFGASVLMTRSQTAPGENVLQKGYSADGSQYKLQIDGSAGRPSCVVVDVRSPVIRMALSRMSSPMDGGTASSAAGPARI